VIHPPIQGPMRLMAASKIPPVILVIVIKLIKALGKQPLTMVLAFP